MTHKAAKARRRRRKGKPFNPVQGDAQKAHIRKSQDLLRNAQVVPAEVDDPYAIHPGDKIVVLRSIRNDPLADMMAKSQIDQCDYVAGRHWQAAYENAEIGGVRAIDPGKEAVDGGRPAEVMTDVQRRGMQDIRAAREALGFEGNVLITDVLGHGLSLKQITIKHAGTFSEAEYKYVRRRFRECLATLAQRFGYANSDRVRPVGSLMDRT
jgi:hypothetical protein